MEEGWETLCEVVTSHLGLFSIEYEVYICIYDFCKIKNIIVPDRAEATAQARHDDRAGLAQALLNVSCLGSARQTWPIWQSIPLHDNDVPRLSCRHIVRHPASFLPPLMPPPPHHPILGIGHMGAGASSLYSSDISPDTDP
jgi:hypothetical protein